MKLHTKYNLQTLIFLSLSISINFVGAQLAMLFKLPIYMDSAGTILSAILLGPFAGGIVGGLTAIINGLSFDPVSLYFIPVYFFTGFSTGIIFYHHSCTGIKKVLSILLIGILVALISSIIVSIVFGGITTSGSSLIVVFLKNSDISQTVAILLTQICTDVCDKFLAFFFAFTVIKNIPLTYLCKLQESCKLKLK